MKINNVILFGVALALLMTGFAPNLSVAQPPNLPAPNTAVPVGDDPRCGVVGDFNSDGKMDIATANQGSNDVSILIADAKGKFQNAPNSPVKVGKMPRSLAVGDFNGDQKTDLAVGNSASNSISVLLGNGNGQFTATPDAPFKVGLRPIAIAVSDFDGDQKADLVVVDNGADDVSIWLGNGAGSFTQAAGSPLKVGKTPFFVAVNDLNDDGQADLVVANSGSNNVSVLRGQGGGGFSPKNDFATELSPRCVAVADLNGDGKKDLAVANTGANSISLLPGDGSGKFGEATSLTIGPSPRSVVAVDLHSDGKLGLAVTSYASQKVFVMVGDGAGNFMAPPKPAYNVGSEPIWSVLADMNGDAKPDLVVINSDSNDITILLGNGNNGFKL